MQTFVVGGTIVDVAFVVDFQCPDEERHRTSLRLQQISLSQLLADLQKLHRNRVFAHHQAPQMIAHTADKMLWFKALADDVIEDEQDVARVA